MMYSPGYSTAFKTICNGAFDALKTYSIAISRFLCACIGANLPSNQLSIRVKPQHPLRSHAVAHWCTQKNWQKQPFINLPCNNQMRRTPLSFHDYTSPGHCPVKESQSSIAKWLKPVVSICQVTWYPSLSVNLHILSCWTLHTYHFYHLH